MANKGGIYKITNVINGRIYVGSTHMFKKRGPSHKNDLIANRHKNTFLQSDFNKCGAEAFIFEILEMVEGNEKLRLACEQKYLDQFFDNGKNCYNLEKIAGFSRIGRGNNKMYNPETDGRAGPKSQEWVENMSAKMTEIYKDPERLKQASDFSKKRWEGHSANITVTNKKTGESVLIDKPVKVWCEEQSLNYKAFHMMVTGKSKSSGGWFLGSSEPKYTSQKGQKRKPLSQEHRAKIAGGKYKDVILVHLETGETMLVGDNIKETCRNNSLSYSSLQKMLIGDCKSACGWTMV